jgi:hypothetical protein
MNTIDVDCNRCKLAGQCPKRGSSPVVFKNRKVFCKILGGYGRSPIDEEVLSDSSKEVSLTSGRCLTLVSIPFLDKASGTVCTELIKVFHQPILHAREKTTTIADSSKYR